MSSIEIGRGVALVCRVGLSVHGDVAAVPGGKRHRLPVDGPGEGSAVLLKRLRRRRMAEQVAPWYRCLVDVVVAGGFGCGMAHAASGAPGGQVNNDSPVDHPTGWAGVLQAGRLPVRGEGYGSRVEP